MGSTVGAVIALTLWSLVVLGWLFVRRFSAMRIKGVSLKGRRGGRGQDLEGVLPPGPTWVSHNYTHLMEQPTLFYAVALALAVMGAGGGWSAGLAWSYVALRIVHSLVQGTSNIIAVRASLFMASSLILAALTLRAVWLLAQA